MASKLEELKTVTRSRYHIIVGREKEESQVKDTKSQKKKGE
jgi:hypothetical protein